MICRGPLPYLPGVICCFRGGPLDGEPGPHPGLVFVLLDEAGQPEIGDLDDVVFADENVPGRQIPENIGRSGTIYPLPLSSEPLDL